MLPTLIKKIVDEQVVTIVVNYILVTVSHTNKVTCIVSIDKNQCFENEIFTLQKIS